MIEVKAKPAEAEYKSFEEIAAYQRRHRRLLVFLGPAFIAGVAYIDPGNFATNITAGSKYGYLLLWVVLVSNLMAILIQSLSAKLGIATGLNLPEVSRENFPKPLSFGLWIQGELVFMPPIWQSLSALHSVFIYCLASRCFQRP